MRRWWLLLVPVLLLSAWPQTGWSEEPAPEAAAESLSEEDRKVVEMLELLEMLEMLDNLDDVAALEETP